MEEAVAIDLAPTPPTTKAVISCKVKATKKRGGTGGGALETNKGGVWHVIVRVKKEQPRKRPSSSWPFRPMTMPNSSAQSYRKPSL
jgi:hypothetical protein